LIREDGNQVSYLSTPINIGFTQPIFAFNPYRWERQIEPLRFEEARKRYIEDLETISLRANNLFFDLLLAQINIEINTLNLANNDTLYEISKGRFSLGRIAENELLQMELMYSILKQHLSRRVLITKRHCFDFVPIWLSKV